MEFSFGHLPFHAQKQAVIEVPRVIKPVFVADQRAGHAAQFQQLVPVGGVAGEPDGGACVQGGMTQLLVAGVEPAAGNMSLAGIGARG